MRISLAITSICKKLSIKYISPNMDLINGYKEDIQDLADIYIQLKDIIIKLQDIEEKRSNELQQWDYSTHQKSILTFKKMIHHTIRHLETVDHEIKKEATKLLRIKKEKNYGKTRRI